jgi:hypothetical protein
LGAGFHFDALLRIGSRGPAHTSDAAESAARPRSAPRLKPARASYRPLFHRANCLPLTVFIHRSSLDSFRNN